jgi:hypothetical protein
MKRTYSLEELPTLRKSLGKYQEEKIMYHHDPTPVKRGQNVYNTVIAEMQCRRPSDAFCAVNDIIAGICRLDHYNQKHRNIPLSQNRMYNILQSMEVINTREIKKMTGLSDRQSQIYLRACKIAIEHLDKHFREHGDFLEDSDIGVDFDAWQV